MPKLAAVASSARSSPRAPVGILLNNPGHIELGAPWEGLSPEQTHKRFCRFIEPAYGIRAIARVLITYQDKRKARDGSKIDTIQEIIERWAPPSENDTSAYVRHVRSVVRPGEGDAVDVKNFGTMVKLVTAIIRQECGYQATGVDWYSQAQIEQGVMLAGLKPEMKPISKSRTIKGAGAALGSAAVAAATKAVEDVGADQVVAAVPDLVIEKVPQVLPVVQTLASVGPYVALAVVALAVGWVIYARLNDRNRMLR